MEGDVQVTIKTGTDRGAGLSEPWSGVFLAIICGNGESVLHWISPISSEGLRRFEQNAVDTFSLKSENCGSDTCRESLPLVLLLFLDLLIGPEFGTWKPDEIWITNNQNDERFVFICQTLLGTENDSAALLTPQRSDQISYGSGSDAKQLTKVFSP